MPTSWFGFVVRAGTPAEAATRLEDSLSRIAALPAVRERIAGTGNAISYSGGKAFAAEMSAEYEK